MIPIKNIYHMLAYFWQPLTQTGYQDIELEEFDNVFELFSRILTQGIRGQIKRGLTKGYQNEMDSLSTLRGKISMSESIKRQAIIRQQMVCHFDEYDIHTLMNRILKSTGDILIKSGKLNKQIQNDLHNQLRYFDKVESLELNTVNWSALSFNRNNVTYKMLMHICYLVCKGLLLTEEEGKRNFSAFLNHGVMSTLYEKFVLSFFQKECSELNAKVCYIDWKIKDGDINYLPKMKTDIALSYGHNQLIIDTKYYPQAMQKSPYNEHRTYISNNLYQIFAYIKNSSFNGVVGGMLLYPTVEYEINTKYTLSGNVSNDIYIRTLNLNKPFEHIKNQLLDIASILFKN